MKTNPLLEKAILLRTLCLSQKWIIHDNGKAEFVEEWKDEDAHKLYDWLVELMRQREPFLKYPSEVG